MPKQTTTEKLEALNDFVRQQIADLRFEIEANAKIEELRYRPESERITTLEDGLRDVLGCLINLLHRDLGLDMDEVEQHSKVVLIRRLLQFADLPIAPGAHGHGGGLLITNRVPDDCHRCLHRDTCPGPRSHCPVDKTGA